MWAYLIVIVDRLRFALCNFFCDPLSKFEKFTWRRAHGGLLNVKPSEKNTHITYMITLFRVGVVQNNIKLPFIAHVSFFFLEYTGLSALSFYMLPYIDRYTLERGE